MPANPEMSWEPTRRRWCKMYRGRRYVVSCRQLGTHETKDASYQAANQWWSQKRIEIDANLHPHAHRILLLQQRIAWARKNGRLELIPGLTDQLEQLEQDTSGSKFAPKPPLRLSVPSSKEGEVYRLSELFVFGDERRGDLATRIETTIDESVWEERLSTSPPDRSSGTPQNRSVQHQVSLWLSDLKVRVDAKQFGHGEYRGQTSYIRHFVSFLGEHTLIDSIKEESWAAYHLDLLSRIGNGKCSPVYAKKLHRSARTFVEYLVSLKKIDKPENLHDKTMKFSLPKQEIEIFSGSEITRLLTESRDTIRLMVLLALNCGMTQIDISDLSHDEVDWEGGRLKRKRSKTSDHANVPMVEYPLWPETLALLNKLRSSDPTRVLVTKSGRPWVCRTTTNNDMVRIEFTKLQPTLSFKHLRKTAATVMGSHPEYRAYAQFFLGHAPTSVADSHYVRPSQERFDGAVRWLRDQFLTEQP